MRFSGKFLLVAAAAFVIYALLIFDPSIPAGEGRVVNLQRLSWQQNLTIVGMGLGVIGALLVIFGSREESTKIVHSCIPNQNYRVDDASLAVEEQFAEAIRKDDIATVKRLVSNRSISQYGRNRNGKGWLQYATALGSVQTAEVLLEYGASPGDKDDLGKTALEEAEAKSNRELLALFAEHAARRNGGDPA